MKYLYHKWMAKVWQRAKRLSERKFDDHFWAMVQVTQEERRKL